MFEKCLIFVILFYYKIYRHIESKTQIKIPDDEAVQADVLSVRARERRQEPLCDTRHRWLRERLARPHRSPLAMHWP